LKRWLHWSAADLPSGTDPSGRLRKHVCGKFQIGYEGAVLLLFIRVVLDPQQKRGVNCDKRGRPVGELQGVPTQLRNGDGAAQEAAGGSAAEATTTAGLTIARSSSSRTLHRSIS
jgi:hypothetical protein